MKSICRAICAAASALVLTAVLLIGCSGDDLLGPGSQAPGSAIDEVAGSSTAKQGTGATTVDVSGDWIWSREDHLTFPVFAAQFVFGIAPEGPTTSARCENSGTMTLVQGGTTLSGTLQKIEHRCVTKGGQVFQDPAAFVPKTITGGVRGRNVELLVDGVNVDCRHSTVASDLEGNYPSTLEGGGPCIVPGHPKSTSECQLDPPPGGTSKALTFSAERT